VYLLKVTIDEISPPVWRSLNVPGTFTLNQLHHAIQVAFGWTNSHLYMFGDWKGKIGDLVLWDDEETISDKSVTISDKLKKTGDKLRYEYDMGDSWKHTIVLESIDLISSERVVCTRGSRAAPPEDCGGIPGYKQLVHHLKHPEIDGYLELLEWLGDGYDPEAFDIKAVNNELRSLKAYIRNFEKENDL
jgi:hypothetical protein